MLFAEPEPTFQQDSERNILCICSGHAYGEQLKIVFRKRKKESNKFPEFESGKYDIHNKLRCEAIFEQTLVSPDPILLI